MLRWKYIALNAYTRKKRVSNQPSKVLPYEIREKRGKLNPKIPEEGFNKGTCRINELGNRQ